MKKQLSNLRHEQVRNAKRFRGGLVFKANRLCVSLDSRLESNKEEEEEQVRSRAKRGQLKPFLRTFA